MDLGYYPGCSLEKSAKDFDLSIRSVFKELGISLHEIPDWNCCGASPAHGSSEELALALPYRNLVQAKEAGIGKILSPCPACYSGLKHTRDELAEEAVRKRLEEITGQKIQESPEVRHLLDVLKEDIGLERLKSPIKGDLQGLKVAAYYGCLTRLPGVSAEDVENPMDMEEIISALGGEALDWSHKTECCGAGLSVTRSEIALRLVHSILEAAAEKGAECIAVICPLCQANLDVRQGDVNKKYETRFHLPVLYLSQLIGLTYRIPYRELGLDRLLISPQEILSTKGILKA